MKRLVTFFLVLCCAVLCSGTGFLTDVSGNSNENLLIHLAERWFLDRVPVAIHVNSQRLQFVLSSSVCHFFTFE